MRISGTDLISRTTTAAHTKLIFAVSSIAIVKWYNIELTPIPPLSNDSSISNEVYRQIALIVIGYLSTGYALHLFGDCQFFRSWASSASVGIGTMAENGIPVPVSKRLRDTFFHMRNTSKKLEAIALKMSEKDNAEAITPNVKELDRLISSIRRERINIEKIFDGVSKGFKRVKCWGWAVLVVWYMMIPLILTVFAIWLLCSNYTGEQVQ